MKLIDKSMLENILFSLLYKEYVNLVQPEEYYMFDVCKDISYPRISFIKMNDDPYRCSVMVNGQFIREIIITYGNEEHDYWIVKDHTPFGDIYLDIYPDRTEIRNEMDVTDPVILEDFSDKLIRKMNCYVNRWMVKNKDATNENSTEKDDD